jgi:hypothetical protein
VGCAASPFSRHYDLERHFQTRHPQENQESDTKKLKCDYSKCPHKDSFRKDHCREHYREYHQEDLIKRGGDKSDKPEKAKKNNKRNSQKKPQSVDEFLATRSKRHLSWWRCSKCVERVKVNINGYMCPRCNTQCEPERVAWRKKQIEQRAEGDGETAHTYAENPQSEGLPSASGSMDYVVGCGQCENAWLRDEDDMTGDGWVPCPRCQPGVN